MTGINGQHYTINWTIMQYKHFMKVLVKKRYEIQFELL